MPEGALVGTSSLRRESQLRHAYPKLRFRPLRGNVNTRLAKLDAGEYDAIILAAAGLQRLGLGARVRALLPQALALPAIGQGVLAVEYRRERSDIAALLAPFADADTDIAARAERALGLVVEGSCDVPLGGLARLTDDRLRIDGFIGLPDGTRLVRDHLEGAAGDAEALGRELGQRLLDAGGREILDFLARRSA